MRSRQKKIPFMFMCLNVSKWKQGQVRMKEEAWTVKGMGLMEKEILFIIIWCVSADVLYF